MKPKTVKIIYWVSTIIFCLGMLYSGIGGLFPNEQTNKVMTDLGYPFYLLTILSVAKILGVLAILQPKFKTLKEWAYAGFTIDFIGAGASFAFTGGSIGMILSPLPFLIVLFVSYFSWKKLYF